MKLLKIRKKTTDNTATKIAILDKDSLGITQNAQIKILEAIKNAGLSQGFLRIALKGGGCSGLTLHYDICDSAKPQDKIFSLGEAKVCIDPKSLSLLGGSTLDTKDYLGSSEFILVNNPSAKSCSCGKSFSF